MEIHVTVSQSKVNVKFNIGRLLHHCIVERIGFSRSLLLIYFVQIQNTFKIQFLSGRNDSKSHRRARADPLHEWWDPVTVWNSRELVRFDWSNLRYWRSALLCLRTTYISHFCTLRMNTAWQEWQVLTHVLGGKYYHCKLLTCVIKWTLCPGVVRSFKLYLICLGCLTDMRKVVITVIIIAENF